MDVNGSPEYVLTWKHWDMPSGPPICALRGRPRRTSDKDFSGWATPTAHNAGTGGASDGNNGARCLQREAKLAGWPTATVNDSLRHPANDNEAKNVTLNHAVLFAGWASPAATTWGGSAEAHLERKRKARANGSSMGLVVSCLDQQVSLVGWATPAARDFKSETCEDWFANQRHQEARGKPLSWQVVPTTRPEGLVLNAGMSRWLMGFPQGEATPGWDSLSPGYSEWDTVQKMLAECCA